MSNMTDERQQLLQELDRDRVRYNFRTAVMRTVANVLHIIALLAAALLAARLMGAHWIKL